MAGLLESIVSFSTQRKEHHNVPRSLLEQLPTELILLICFHLSNVDIACLALCCHGLRRTIGTESFLFANEHSKDRGELLTRISQDVASYYFCHFCSMLHPWKNTNLPQTCRPRKFTSCMRRSERDFLLSSINTNKQRVTTYFFKFAHLQLAMRRYRYGPSYGISTDSLSYVEVLQPKLGHGVTTLMSVEARVCPGKENLNEDSLHLRIQQWARVPLFCPDIASLAEMVDMSICTHINFERAPPAMVVPSLTIGSLGSYQNVTYQCHHCHADFQFQLQNIEIQAGQKAQVVILTKWLDLGDGLDPESPFWVVQHHLIPKVHLPHRDVGSVRSRFESEPGWSQHELTVRNGLLMSKEKFRQDLYPVDSGRWVERPAR